MPKKQTIEPVQVKKRGRIQWLVYTPKDLISRINAHRRFFASKAKAEAFCANLIQLRKGDSDRLLLLPPEQRSLVAHMLDKIGSVEHLESAVNAWLASRPKADKTLAKCAAECLADKKATNRSQAYRTTFKSHMKTFVDDQPASCKCHEVTTAQISDWLAKQNWKPATKQGVLKNLRILFEFARRRGYVTSNPAEAATRPIRDQTPPGILTVEQVERLMRACEMFDPKLCGFIAVQVFAGLRPVEARILTAARIGNQIEVWTTKTRSRARRFVQISPNLHEWLSRFKPHDLPPVNWRKRLERVRWHARLKGDPVREELPWPHDCLRHSFASYHLALHGSPDKTAHEMGHGSTQMLYAHYRELVTKESAEAFWNIRPHLSGAARLGLDTA